MKALIWDATPSMQMQWRGMTVQWQERTFVWPKEAITLDLPLTTRRSYEALRMLNTSGERIDAVTIPGSLLVKFVFPQPGPSHSDLITIIPCIPDDILKSAVHRMVNRAGVTRDSTVLWHGLRRAPLVGTGSKECHVRPQHMTPIALIILRPSPTSRRLCSKSRKRNNAERKASRGRDVIPKHNSQHVQVIDPEHVPAYRDSDILHQHKRSSDKASLTVRCPFKLNRGGRMLGGPVLLRLSNLKRLSPSFLFAFPARRGMSRRAQSSIRVHTMQHISQGNGGSAESSTPFMAQHRASSALSILSNHPHDPYAFSRVGNQRFVGGNVKSFSLAQTQYPENVERLALGVFPSSIAPSQSARTISQTPPQSIFTLGHPSATNHPLLVPPVANALSSSTAIETAATPLVSQDVPSTAQEHSEWQLARPSAIFSAPLPNSGKHPQGLRQPLQSHDLPLPSTDAVSPYTTNENSICAPYPSHREDNQVSTDEDIDTLEAFFYNGRRRLLPTTHISTYSSLAGALSEAGPSTSCILHSPGALVGSQDVDDPSRNESATDGVPSDAIGFQLASLTQTTVTSEALSHEVLPFPCSAPLPSHSPVDFCQEAAPLAMTPSVVALTSVGPVGLIRSRKRKAPPVGEAGHVAMQAKQRKRRTVKGMKKTIPGSQPGPESGSEGVDEDAPVQVQGSAEAIRSRTRRGRTKEGIHALYEEVALFIKVEPFESLALDEVVQIAVKSLKARREKEQERDKEVQSLRSDLTAMQSRDYELQLRHLEGKLHQSQNLIQQLRHQLIQREGELTATQTNLRCNQEQDPRP
ncbi:hypothetical protein DENSPDRAFT_855027 [Dentipellis sp. KUC8613]|nr:hypothetical protein DENSPDRAFT_855027 [Dentipellis sp. KUC8613]